MLAALMPAGRSCVHHARHEGRTHGDIGRANENPAGTGNGSAAGQKCLLVMYGQEYAQTRHDFGLTITVARQQSKIVSELSFLTAVRTAKVIARRRVPRAAGLAAAPGEHPD